MRGGRGSIMVGVQREPNAIEAHIFKTLAGRNAINFHPPSYAAEVVLSTEDAGALRRRFESLLTGPTRCPSAIAAASLMPAPVVSSPAADPPAARRALLIVGSPKTNEPSASGALGGFLSGSPASAGLGDRIADAAGQSASPGRGKRTAVASGSRRADPAGLSSLRRRAATSVDQGPGGRWRRTGGPARHPRTRLVGIVNSGFPETHQNAVALAICREFAAQSGFIWAGGLALGAGGAVGGQPLTEAKRSGPSVKNVIAA
jgi:hypothetical protein